MGRGRVGLVFGIWVFVLLVAASSPVLNVPVVEASGTIYIRSDGTVEGTDKIQRVGDLYTFTDDIFDSIVVERSNIRIDGNAYALQGLGSSEWGDWGFCLFGTKNVTIENTNVKGFSIGVYLNSTSQSHIHKNSVSNNDYGIVLSYYSSNNTIVENNITDNHWEGISLNWHSDSNCLSENNLTNNYLRGIWLQGLVSNNTVSRNSIRNNITNPVLDHRNAAGICLIWASNNKILGNRIADSGQFSIVLSFDPTNRTLSSNNNTISKNSMLNSRFGIYLDYHSINNTICENMVSNNSRGIISIESSYNVLYHNNFVSNEQQVNSWDSENTWDDGYPSGGNYWSDYTGSDIDGDGIGNTPYIINANNQDRYPLMNPWDKTPPITADDYDDFWHATDFTIALTATDNLRGVAETYYKINNEEPIKNVTFNGQPFITTEAAHNKLEYWSVDKAGNEELPHKIITEIKLDKTTPTANAGSDRTVNEDTQITLDGSASSDNLAIATYTWTFTDVTTRTLTGEKPTYTFNTPSIYTITLNVTDNARNWATDTVNITVLDVTKPVANAGQDQTVNKGATVTLDAGGSTDNVGIVSYEWDFGDGTTDIGITTTHTYSAVGTYTVMLTVKDAAGNTANDLLTITVHSEVTPPSPTETFPIWIAGAAGAAVATIAIVAAAVLLWKRRK